MFKGIVKEKNFMIGSPAMVWQFIFFYLPLLLMLITSVKNISTSENTSSFTFDHFATCLSKTHLSIILKSLFLSFSIAVISFLIAYPLAHYIIFHAKKYKSLFLFFLIVPFWTNFLLHVYAWFF